MAEPQDFIIVEAPDGTEIEFPSTMSDDDISNVMRQQYPPGGQFLNVMNKMGMGAPTQQQLQNEVIPNVQAKAAGYDYALGQMGDKIIQNKMKDPENVGWTPGGRDPATFAANKLGRAEGTYLGFGDEALGLVNKDAGDFKRKLKKHAQFRHPEEFGEGQLEGNVFNGLVTAPVAAPKWLQAARFLPRGTQAASAGAASAAAWDTLDQMGTSSGSAEQRVRGIDTDRTKMAAGMGGALGGVMSAFTRTLSNGQSEFARVLEGVVDDAGSVSDDGVRGLERFLADNRVTLDDVTLGRIDSAIQESRQTGAKALALPVRIKDVLIDAFEDGSGNFRKAVETQLRGTMVEGGDGAARIAQSVDEDFSEARTALNDHYGKRLGQRSRIKSEDDTLAQLRDIGNQGYEPILDKGPTTYHGARALDEVLSGPGMRDGELMSPLKQYANADGFELSDFIEQNPLRAAHWMQSKARQLVDSGQKQYIGLRTRLLDAIEEASPGYNQVRKKYGDEFGNLQALEFGDKFLTNAGKAFEIDKMARAFKSLSAAQKRVALLSVRDVMRAASGKGKKNAPPRLTRVGEEQVLDSLETVFGARGARVAQGIEDVQDFVQSRVNIDSRRGSPTAPNQEAVTRAKQSVQSPLRRKVGGFLQNVAGDAAFTASGFAPVNSIRKGVGKAGEAISGDVSGKMNALASLLEAKVAQPMTQTPKRVAPQRGPDGRFLKKDASEAMTEALAKPKAEEPVQNGMLSNGAFTDTIAGAGLGSVSGNFVDYNQDGVIDQKDVAIGAAGGAVGLRTGRKVAQRATKSRPAGMLQYEQARLRVMNANPDLQPGSAEYQSAVMAELKSAGYGGTQSRDLKRALAPEVDTTGIPEYRLRGVKPEDQWKVVVSQKLGQDGNPSQGHLPSGQLIDLARSPEEQAHAVFNGINTLKKQMGMTDDEAFQAIREATTATVTKDDVAKLLLEGDEVEDVYRLNQWLFTGDDAATLTPEQLQRAMADLPPDMMPADPLPMDEASRMARAREMGFDTEQTLYHGTGANFEAFDPSMADTKRQTGTPAGAMVFTDLKMRQPTPSATTA